MKIEQFSGPYRWLSNFWPISVMGPGDLLYPSVEHAYQASKSLDPKDWERLRGGKPENAKKLGKSIKVRPDWDEVKLEIMEDLVRDKFEEPYLKHNLRGTGDAELVEGNWWGDTYWGVCRGKGENHLGKILMKIRGS